MKQQPARGRDIRLYLDAKRAKGVLSLHIGKNIERRALKEYLCEQPYDNSASRVTYRITITADAAFTAPGREPFVLSVADADITEHYENCVLKEKQIVYAPDAAARITYIFESDHRRKGGCICGR